MARNITLGISPCPNDTFIFHALLFGLVRPDERKDVAIHLHMADVEELNSLVLAGKLAFSKVSLGVVPHILDKYMLLSSGGALGFGCGPLLVARDDNPGHEAVVASPGKMTTANLLLDMHGKYAGKRLYMLFSHVMTAVANGKADCGLVIHEGRFTYEKLGLKKILDLGEWWEENFGLPLPLGAIVVRRDVPRDLGLAMQEAIGRSLEHAWQNPALSRAFIKANAQEMDDEVINAHIETFVTQYSRDLGQEGRTAIEMLIGNYFASRGKILDNDIILG